MISKGLYTSLFSTNWFGPLEIMVKGINQTSAASPTNFNQVCNEFSPIFYGTLGLYNRSPVSLQLDPMIRSVRLKPYSVLFTLKLKIDESWITSLTRRS